MENLDSLKVIEMGALNEESANFCFASLQLMNFPKLQLVALGKSSFCNCPRVVLKDLPQLSTLLLGENAFRCRQSEIILQYLPSLTTVLSEGEDPGINTCIKDIIMENYRSQQDFNPWWKASEHTSAAHPHTLPFLRSDIVTYSV
ncbi:hypothetical protein WA577_001205 [Blastocystis sp. JDR]